MSSLEKQHYLLPGTLYASREPMLLETVLGSCVAVSLWHPHTQTGGLNHFMLPFWNGEGLPSPRYGNVAIERLMENMVRLGAPLGQCVAKVFGGANQFANHEANALSVGNRNAQLALEMLAQHHIPVVAQHLGGTQGRKIRFHLADGKIQMKLLGQG